MYTELNSYKKALELTSAVYSVVKKLPKAETYAMSDQLRRAVVSIPSNIAEGDGRGTTKDYIHFLYQARGSLYEVDTQLRICSETDMIPLDDYLDCISLVAEVGKLLNAQITSLKNKISESDKEGKAYVNA